MVMAAWDGQARAGGVCLGESGRRCLRPRRCLHTPPTMGVPFTLAYGSPLASARPARPLFRTGTYCPTQRPFADPGANTQRAHKMYNASGTRLGREKQQPARGRAADARLLWADCLLDMVDLPQGPEHTDRLQLARPRNASAL